MRLVVARLHTVTRCCRLDLRTVDCHALRQKLSVLLVSFVAKSSVSRAACFSPSISGSVRGSFALPGCRRLVSKHIWFCLQTTLGQLSDTRWNDQQLCTRPESHPVLHKCVLWAEWICADQRLGVPACSEPVSTLHCLYSTCGGVCTAV